MRARDWTRARTARTASANVCKCAGETPSDAATLVTAVDEEDADDAAETDESAIGGFGSAVCRPHTCCTQRYAKPCTLELKTEWLSDTGRVGG